jgi:hypothetical protein
MGLYGLARLESLDAATLRASEPRVLELLPSFTPQAGFAYRQAPGAPRQETRSGAQPGPAMPT